MLTPTIFYLYVIAPPVPQRLHSQDIPPFLTKNGSSILVFTLLRSSEIAVPCTLLGPGCFLTSQPLSQTAESLREDADLVRHFPSWSTGDSKYHLLKRLKGTCCFGSSFPLMMKLSLVLLEVRFPLMDRREKIGFKQTFRGVGSAEDWRHLI